MLKNPDNSSGYAQIGSNVTTTSYSDSIAVHLTDWINTSYKVEACNTGGCTTSSAVFIARTDTLSTVGYVKASNTGAGDWFGWDIALSSDGSTLAVSARYEDSNDIGINGTQSNNSATDAGAVYVFKLTGTTWAQQAYLKASNTEAGDQFGESLALSADGNVLAVGSLGEDSGATGVNGDTSVNDAVDAGAVYVFTRSGTTWTQQAYLKASNSGASDYFGATVALSGDGSTLAVGAPLESSNSASSPSDNSVISAGAVYVFVKGSAGWTQQAYLKAPSTDANDYFGSAVALSSNGNTLAVGQYLEDGAATVVNGGYNNAATDAGAVYVFIRDSTTWTQQAYVKASNAEANDYFGAAVSLSGDGNTLAVGAFGEDSNSSTNQGDNTAGTSGAAYVFTRSGVNWTQQAYIKASTIGAGDAFGQTVALSTDGATLAIGAQHEDANVTGINGNASDDSSTDAGAVYVFTLSGSVWSQKAYVKASNAGAGDYFGGVGLALSADGTTLAVGARREDSNATGIGGDITNNASTDSGAVYLY